MAVFRVAKGTMPKALIDPPVRLVAGRWGMVKVDTSVPHWGTAGPRTVGGMPPRTSTPIRSYEDARVFGIRSNPRRITGGLG